MTSTDVSRASRCVTAELLAGVTRALTSDHVPRNDAQLITWWSAVHRRSLDVDDVDDWSAALRYSAHHRDPARFDFLIKSVLSPRPLDVESSSLEHVKQLNLIGALLPEHSWLALSYATDLLHYLAEHLTHLNKLVRLEIASLLNMIAGIYAQSAVHAPHVPVEGFTQFMRQLIDRLDLPDPSDTDSKAMSEQARFKETIVSVVHKAVAHNNAAPLMPYLSRLLVALFAHAVDSNDDVKNSARKTLLLVAQTSVPQQYLDEYIAAIEAISRSTNFQVRKTLLLFTQIMVFNHAYTLTQHQIQALLGVIAELLYDARIEVADTARVALSSFIKSTAPRITLADLIARFGDQLTGAATTNESRLGAALGLRGVIESYPYDVPDWMPAALTKLVTYLRDKNNAIRSCVNDGLQEFWRTHRDDWELNFKKKFTAAQINAIQQRTSTSYYA